MTTLQLTLILLQIFHTAFSLTSCRDQNNQPVDWYAFYKLPRVYSGPWVAESQNGTGFLYLDSNNKTWQLSSETVMSSNQALAYTLQQYYTSDESFFKLLYNDEFPDGNWSATSGHTKGGALFDMQSGYWLIHSIPKFPNISEYWYPPNAHAYGQMGLCVSFTYTSLGDIGNQLAFNQPNIYDINVPFTMATQYPILANLQKNIFINGAPYSSVKQLTSLNGQQFTHFAKNGAFNNDLYFNLIAPTLRTDLRVESWQHGTSNINSSCTPSHTTDVLNAKAIQLPYGINFTNYDDHSKYAIAYRNAQSITNYICIGDINRQTHQRVRGGGSMCIIDADLYQSYVNIISETYPCYP